MVVLRHLKSSISRATSAQRAPASFLRGEQEGSPARHLFNTRSVQPHVGHVGLGIRLAPFRQSGAKALNRKGPKAANHKP